MKRNERRVLEALSIQAFGGPYEYQKRMKRPSYYVHDTFGSVEGKRAAGYATVEQIREAMLKIIEERTKDEK